VKLPPFEYRRASSLEETLAALAEGGDEAKILAGGQSLVTAMAFRLVRPALLVDVNDVSGLAYVAREGGGLRLGALVRHAVLERAEGLDGPWRALREAVTHVGHYPVRVRGTFGGSIAHADPAAELAVVATTFDAQVVAVSTDGARTIAAADFFVAPFMTTLAPEEVVVEVELPAPPPGTVSAFEELAQRSGDFALASVCAALALEDGKVSWARIGLGSVGATPLRAPEAEGLLVGSDAGEAAVEAAAHAAASACDPFSDSHASAAYRRHLVGVLVGRALRRARSEAA
jgi:carbon-monoxide dehydrogenase medium subunit/6-hydroxypseudooxynicotine dehydrogenase subunit alpha